MSRFNPRVPTRTCWLAVGRRGSVASETISVIPTGTGFGCRRRERVARFTTHGSLRLERAENSHSPGDGYCSRMSRRPLRSASTLKGVRLCVGGKRDLLSTLQNPRSFFARRVYPGVSGCYDLIDDNGR